MRQSSVRAELITEKAVLFCAIFDFKEAHHYETSLHLGPKDDRRASGGRKREAPDGKQYADIVEDIAGDGCPERDFARRLLREISTRTIHDASVKESSKDCRESFLQIRLYERGILLAIAQQYSQTMRSQQCSLFRLTTALLCDLYWRSAF